MGGAGLEATELEQPLVSCIIPAYNAADTIVRAIESARRQTYPNVEIVVVNDGSTDNTEEVVLSRFPEIRYIRHVHNRGPSAARNSGARAARGAVLAFLDADDEWLPVKTEIQLDALGRLPNAGVLFTGMLILAHRRRTRILPARARVGLTHFAARDILKGSWLSISAMTHASTFWTFGGFDESRPLLEAELWARIAAGGLALARLELPLYVQHVRAGSVSRNVSWTFDALMHTIDLWAPDSAQGRSIGMSPEEYARLRAKWVSTLTLRLIRAGQFSEARKRLSDELAGAPRRQRLRLLLFLATRCPWLVWTIVRAVWSLGGLIRYMPGRATHCRYARVLATCATDAERFLRAFPRDRAAPVLLPTTEW